MTYYLKEINRIKSNCYGNQWQLDATIGTRRYINSNFDKDLNLDFLSGACATSKFHLIRLFKKYYGQTPKQYITDKRMEKAKELLKAGHTVTEVCFAVGFESPSSFCTLFKYRQGVTPTEFKKAIFTKSDQH